MSQDPTNRRQPARILEFPAQPGAGLREDRMDRPAFHARTATGLPTEHWTTIAGGRAGRPGQAPKAGLIMSFSNLGLSHMQATARHADFVAEAMREQTLASLPKRRSSDGPGSVMAMRMRVGDLLIRIGERLRGAADERGAALGSLRPARS